MNPEHAPSPSHRTTARQPSSSLSLSEAARLLTGLGGHEVTIEMLQEDIARGAPCHADGSLNLVRYAAWLTREARGHEA